MILWIVLAAITALTLLAMLRPLFRGRQAAPSRAAFDLEIYRDQLAELSRERDRGLLGAAEFQAAEREVARRLLAAAERDEGDAGAGVPGEGPRSMPQGAAAGAGGIALRRWLALGIAALVPIASLALYLDLGSPTAPDFPYAERQAELARAKGMPDIDTAIARLERHLAQQPDDLKGWLLLARSYGALDRYGKAAEAYRRALELDRGDIDVAAGDAETLVMQAGGGVPPAAKEIFETIHAKLPSDPRARFYLGLARAQAGDGKGALEEWLALEAEAPADAPWLAALRNEMARVAAAQKLDLAALRAALPPKTAGAAGPAPAQGESASQAPSAAPGPSPAPGPSAADIAAAAKMSPEARQAMVRGMVEKLAERLKSDPGDVAGWRRLGRSYHMLGEDEKAADALEHAAGLAPKDPDVLVEYGSALVAAARPAGTLPPAAIEVMRRVLAVDGQRREALWLVGEAEVARGDKTAAADLWGRLLAQLSPGTPDYDAVKQKLDGLGLPR